MGALKTAGSGVVPVFSPVREKTERTGREVMIVYEYLRSSDAGRSCVCFQKGWKELS